MSGICAGIVSYNPDITRLQKNINSILPQVDKLYVVDNGSSNILEVKKICGNDENIVILANSDNYGIARALNQLCEMAEEERYDWILTLDQDTVCPDDLIVKMVPYTNKDDLGIICPAVYYEGIGKNKQSDNEVTYVYACMTSASLTRIKAWREAGGFREEYFIDFVDNEFCMKLKLHGYKVLRVNSCVINHQLGTSSEKRLFGVIPVRYSSHSPLRFYYMVRNNRIFISE